MAVVVNQFVNRAGLLPGTFVNQCRFYRSVDGYKNVPFLKQTQEVWKPLALRTLVQRSSISRVGYYGSIYGLSWHGAERVWATEPGFGSYSANDIQPGACGASTADFSMVRNRARARCIAKFSASQRAEMGTTITEANKSVVTAISRYQKLNVGLAFLAEGTLRSIARLEKLLRVRRLPRWKVKLYLKARNLGGLWLEYWMGWAPLFGDIHNALVVLTEGAHLTPKIVSGSAKHKWKINNTSTNANSSGLGDYRVRVRANVLTINPNQRLRRDLGLTNPWLTIHDIIPWSWLLAWTHNLREVIQQLDDLYGVELEPMSVCKTERARLVVTRSIRPFNGADWDTGVVRRTILVRSNAGSSLPVVKFVFRVPSLSDTRMLTLASLLSIRLAKLG